MWLFFFHLKLGNKYFKFICKWSVARYGSIPVRLIFTWMLWNITLTFCIGSAMYSEFYSVTRPNPASSVANWSAKEREWNQLKRSICLFGHNDFSVCCMHLHPGRAALYCSVVACFCSPRINGKAALKTSSSLITSLIRCATCCLRKPWKPESLWKATICVYHSYFMDNNFDFSVVKATASDSW